MDLGSSAPSVEYFRGLRRLVLAQEILDLVNEGCVGPIARNRKRIYHHLRLSDHEGERYRSLSGSIVQFNRIDDTIFNLMPLAHQSSDAPCRIFSHQPLLQLFDQGAHVAEHIFSGMSRALRALFSFVSFATGHGDSPHYLVNFIVKLTHLTLAIRAVEMFSQSDAVAHISVALSHRDAE
jgi:hypothetical protein